MTGLIASIDLTGGYFSPIKIVVMLVLALPWLWIAPRVQKLARRTHEPNQLIGGVLLGAGALGMLLWLLLPTFGLGMLIYVLLVAGSSLGYVAYHNGRVERDFRLLTREHIHSVFTRDQSHKVPVVTKLKVYDAAGRIVAPPLETAFPEDKLAYNLSQELLYDLLYHRASEADLAPAGQEAKLRFLIDGAIAPRPTWRPEDSERAIQYIKALADLDPDERRKPQRGTLSVDLASQPVDMVITTAGTASGQRMQFRIVQESIQTRIEELGMDEEMVAKVRAANQVGGGLILVASRPKNGLTSTLYSLLRCHDSFTMQLTTLEAKVTSELENVSQHAYGDDAAVMTKQLASALRQDPHVVMIDQCREPTAAGMIADAAKERLFLLGVVASDSFSALAKWIKTCGNVQEALGSLKVVVAQVLVRKLCPNCREAYRPDPSLLAKANLKADEITQFYRPPTKPLLDEKGKPLVDDEGNPIPCPTCRGTGYFGRTAAFELLEATDELRQLVAAGAPLTKIKAACRKKHMLYLQEQALRKVIAGVSSVQEVIRVTQTQSKPKAKG